MDIRQLIRVLRERRKLIIVGLSAGLLLALLSFFRLGFDGVVPKLTPRSEETWQNELTLFITQKGFPAGRAVPSFRPSDPKTGRPAVQIDDQSRLANLAPLYAQLAVSDAVKKLAFPQGEPDATVSADPVTYTTTQFSYPQVLPLISLRATAGTPELTTRAVERVAEAFRAFVAVGQVRAAIAPDDRVLVQVAKRADKPILISGRSKILPLIVLFAVATLVLGLAVVLDNMKQSAAVRRGPEQEEPEPESEPSGAYGLSRVGDATRRVAAGDPAPTSDFLGVAPSRRSAPVPRRRTKPE